MAGRLLTVALLTGLTISWTVPAAAQSLGRILVSGESPGKAQRMRIADQLAKEEKWPEAVDEYLRLLQDPSDDDLILLDNRHSLSPRRLCHLRLASFPPAPLKIYRDRVEAQAKTWWDQWDRDRDSRFLRLLVDDAFCSRYGDRALDTLGDMAFERGDFDEAHHWWRMLAPMINTEKTGKRAGNTLDLFFPNPKVNVARVHAKLLLCHLMAGHDPQLEKEWDSFKKQYGHARGELAGIKGNLAAILADLRRHPDNLAPPFSMTSWSTFGLRPTRNTLIASTLPAGLWNGTSWSVSLNKLGGSQTGAWEPGGVWEPRAGATSGIESAHVLTASAASQGLMFYPVLAEGLVLVSGVNQVWAWDIASGHLKGTFSQSTGQRVRSDSNQNTDIQQRAFTLTIAEDHIFVRLGSQALTGRSDREPTRRGDSHLVCLDLQPTPEGKLTLRWRAEAQETSTETAQFEGTPLVVNGRVFIARARFSGVQVATSLDCYSAVTGARLWRRDFCEAPELKEASPRHRPYLLTLAGPNVVYCSHSGAVLAMDAQSGRRAWAVRYPSRGLTLADGSASPRNLAPALFADGRIFAAPADADRMICIDAYSGQLIWESAAVEVCHLLAVAGGKVIATTANWPRGIQGFDAETGAALRHWRQPEDGLAELPTYGRGFMAGGMVYWPTFYGLRVLNGDSSQLDAAESYYLLHRLGERLGNLAFGQGCLAIAGKEKLTVLVAPSPDNTKASKGANSASTPANYH